MFLDQKLVEIIDALHKLKTQGTVHTLLLGATRIRDICETRTTKRRILRFNGSLSLWFSEIVRPMPGFRDGRSARDLLRQYEVVRGCSKAYIWVSLICSGSTGFSKIAMSYPKKTEKVEKFKGSLYSRGIQIKMQSEIYETMSSFRKDLTRTPCPKTPE